MGYSASGTPAHAFGPGAAAAGTVRLGGQDPREALRALKRRISDALYRRLRAGARRAATGYTQVTGPGGQAGNGTDASAAALTPNTSSSAQPLPDPGPHYAPPQPHDRKSAAHGLRKRCPRPLDTKRLRYDRQPGPPERLSLLRQNGFSVAEGRRLPAGQTGHAA